MISDIFMSFVHEGHRELIVTIAQLTSAHRPALLLGAAGPSGSRVVARPLQDVKSTVHAASTTALVQAEELSIALAHVRHPPYGLAAPYRRPLKQPFQTP